MVKEKTGFTVARVNNFKCAPKKSKLSFGTPKHPTLAYELRLGERSPIFLRHGLTANASG